eukprot:3621580-Prymnesium_polylepis.1
MLGLLRLLHRLRPRLVRRRLIGRGLVCRGLHGRRPVGRRPVGRRPVDGLLSGGGRPPAGASSRG